MEILKREHDGRVLGHALEEQPPATEQVSAVGIRALLQPQQVRQAWLDQTALPFVRDERRHRFCELVSRAVRCLLLGDPGPRADHLGQRPVGDTLPVGEASTLVPVTLFLDPVEVLEELP